MHRGPFPPPEVPVLGRETHIGASARAAAARHGAPAAGPSGVSLPQSPDVQDQGAAGLVVGGHSPPARRRPPSLCSRPSPSSQPRDLSLSLYPPCLAKPPTHLPGAPRHHPPTQGPSGWELGLQPVSLGFVHSSRRINRQGWVTCRKCRGRGRCLGSEGGSFRGPSPEEPGRKQERARPRGGQERDAAGEEGGGCKGAGVGKRSGCFRTAGAGGWSPATLGVSFGPRGGYGAGATAFPGLSCFQWRECGQGPLGRLFPEQEDRAWQRR